jgi:sugar phosphate isomerase/epimerase
MTLSMNQVAVQLYTLRSAFSTRDDVLDTLTRVRQMGYENVQFFTMPLPVHEMREILDDLGLGVCGVDVAPSRLTRELDAVVDEMATLGCEYITYSFEGTDRRRFGGELGEFTATLNDIGERLKATECSFAYHNHSFELVRYGRWSALHEFYERTAAAGIQAEIDTYWIQHGGGDPAEWIRELAGRIPIVHLKDMAIGPDLEQHFAELGEGNMNWASILAAADEVGVEWLVVEQDTCQGDPFESVATSYAYLAAALDPSKASEAVQA